jgi:integrase
VEASEHWHAGYEYDQPAAGKIAPGRARRYRRPLSKATGSAMKVMLTDSRLKAIAPTEGMPKRQIIWDAAQPNFGVRITDKGRVTFVVVGRRKGHKYVTFHRLGSYPAMTLKDARAAAPAVLQLFVKGMCPKEVEEERLRAEQGRRQYTFGIVAEEYIANWLVRRALRTARAQEFTIRRELLGQQREGDKWVFDDSSKCSWYRRPIAEITRRDVIERIENLVARGTPYQARKTLAYIKKLYNWAIARDLYGIEQNPAVLVMPRDIIGKLKKGDRVLSDSELRLIWQASFRLGATENERSETDQHELGEAQGLFPDYPFGPLVRLLMLTGSRLRESSDLRRAEFDEHNAVLVIPASRMKANEPHTVPLIQSALDLLRSLPQFKGDFLFSTTAGTKPVSGFSKAKVRLDRAAAQIRAESRTGQEGRLPEAQNALPRWTFHDIRRTVRTRLSVWAFRMW